MLLQRRNYTRSRKGTIRFQAQLRGYNVRRLYAAIKVEQYYRRFIARKHFLLFKKAVVALQSRTRQRQATALLLSFKKEQKDVGKLKENNERLKQEMASLRAMLAAQAKESAADAAHTKEMAEKEKVVAGLEKRIAEIEKELTEAKAKVADLEDKLQKQYEESKLDKDQIQKMRRHRPTVSATSSRAPDSPQSKRRQSSMENIVLPTNSVPPPGISIPELSNYVSPEILAEHRAKVAILEEELEEERRARREVDGEVIKLRAAMNGVELDENEVRDLLTKRQDSGAPGLRSETMSEDSYDASTRYETLTCIAFVYSYCWKSFDKVLTWRCPCFARYNFMILLVVCLLVHLFFAQKLLRLKIIDSLSLEFLSVFDVSAMRFHVQRV
jgi:myosin heavy subunit